MNYEKRAWGGVEWFGIHGPEYSMWISPSGHFFGSQIADVYLPRNWITV